jgi:hypothetical protein
MRRAPAIEAAIVKSREEKAYSDVYSDVKKKTWNRIYNEARERFCESIGAFHVQLAMNNGTYDEELEPFASQVIEEEKKKGDLDASISKQADEVYQERRESELLLLIRDDNRLIEKLSRYHASLMNAANRVIQQLRLIKIMGGSRSLIAFE